MVGLLADRPQRGERITNLQTFLSDFEALFNTHCRDVEHLRVTGEKALQSHLIREAQVHGRMMSLNLASDATDNPVELLFITDEISLPVENGKKNGEMVCDILALRRDGGRSTPVLIELKDRRQLTRLVAQVERYAGLIDQHSNLFAELYGALLGEEVAFDGPAERWILWPSAGSGPDERTLELQSKGIRLVGYTEATGGYSFVAGPAPAFPSHPVATPRSGSRQ